jgi:hypothetical protein
MHIEFWPLYSYLDYHNLSPLGQVKLLQFKLRGIMESPTVQPKEGRESEATDPRVLSPRLPSAPVVGRSRFCGFRDFADLVDKWLSTGLFGQLFRLADS